mgnify:CR=1 FL=1
MATTRIMPLHVGKGRTESRAISDIIDYVANPKKTDNGKLITGYACDSRTADAEFLLAKRKYIAATGRVRGADDVIAYHDKLDRLEEICFMEKLITRKEAAEILGISIATLDAARNNGLISYVQYVQNGCVYFTSAGLQEYIAKCTHRAKPAEKNATYRRPRRAGV